MNQITPEQLHLSLGSRFDETPDRDLRKDGTPEHSDQTGFKFLFILLSGLYIPVILLWSGIIPIGYRFNVLSIVTICFLLFGFQRRYQFRELGYRIDNFTSSLSWNFIFCLLGTLCLYYAYKNGLLSPAKKSDIPYCYVFYVAFLAPVQELLFRGVLFAEMRRIGSVDFKIMLLVSTFSFCFLHIIYNRPPLLIISLISGLIWSIIYMKWPNIWGVSISHALLGATAMFLGVI